MTNKQFKAAIESLGMTQASAAEFLGVGLRTAHGWANSDPVPVHVAKLLRLMIKLGIKPEDV